MRSCASWLFFTQVLSWVNEMNIPNGLFEVWAIYKVYVGQKTFLQRFIHTFSRRKLLNNSWSYNALINSLWALWRILMYSISSIFFRIKHIRRTLGLRRGRQWVRCKKAILSHPAVCMVTSMLSFSGSETERCGSDPPVTFLNCAKMNLWIRWSWMEKDERH